MKLTRASYLIFFAMIIFLLIRPMVGTFSEDLEDKIFLPTLIIFTILLVLGLVIAFFDRELFHVVVDERTKRVDRSAVYYSWWFNLLFMFFFGAAASINNFTIIQFVYVLTIEMFLTMLFFHLYFNFKGK